MIPKLKFKAAVRGLGILPEFVRVSADAWGALQSAAEDEAHRVLSCLAALAESDGRSEPLARDVLAMRKILNLAPARNFILEADAVKAGCGRRKSNSHGSREADINTQCCSKKAKPDAKVQLGSHMKLEPGSLKHKVKSEPDEN